MINKLLEDAETGLDPSPAYFYCTRNVAEPKRADPEHILRCIAKQLSYCSTSQSLLLPACTIYNQRARFGDLASPLTLKECTNLIITLTEHRSSTTIIIDALDECNTDKVHKILDALNRIVRNSQGLVKVFVSSRDDQGLVCRLNGYYELKIKASHNQGDISTFVHHETIRLVETKRLLYGFVSLALKERIEQTLCELAQGM